MSGVAEWAEHVIDGSNIVVPSDWEVLDEVSEGVRFVACEPSTLDEFRANVVVTLDEVAADEVEAWEVSSDLLMERTLDQYLLLDRAHVDTSNGIAFHRTGEHVTEGGWFVTFDQWTVARDGIGCTMTLTVQTLDFEYWADAFLHMGERFADVPSEGIA